MLSFIENLTSYLIERKIKIQFNKENMNLDSTRIYKFQIKLVGLSFMENLTSYPLNSSFN